MPGADKAAPPSASVAPSQEGRRERGKATRRADIVLAARRLIQARGEGGFSMQELAEEADVSPMTPYNLFGSKQGVMLAVLDDDLRSFTAGVQSMRVDALERIFRTVTLARNTYEAEPNFYRTVFRGAELGSASENERVLFRAPRRAVWIALTHEAMAAGYVSRVVDGDLLGTSLSQILFSCVVDWLSGLNGLREFEAQTHLGMALLLLGVAAPEARPRLLDRIAKSQRLLARSAQTRAA